MKQGFVLISLGAMLLSACAASTAPPEPTPTPEPVEVTVTLTEFQIEASQTTFEAGRTYRFVVTNGGALNHEFMIMPPVEDATIIATEESDGMEMGDEGDDEGESMGMDGGMSMEEMDAMALAMIEESELPPGSTQTVEVTFDEDSAGDNLEFACHVAGHYPAGMKAPITVTN